MGVKLIKDEPKKNRKQHVPVYAHVPGLIILMILMIALMAWSVYEIIDISRFSNICKRTKSVVVDYEIGEDDSDDEIYWAIHEYEVDGRVYRITENDKSYFEPEIGEKGEIFYDPANPQNAKFEVGGLYNFFESLQYLLYIVVGAFFFVLSLAFLMAHFGATMPWIQLMVGIAFTLIGVIIPIISLGLGIPLLFVGVIGIYLIIRGYLQITGRHEEDQGFQDKINPVVEGVFKNLAESQIEKIEEYNISDGNEKEVIYRKHVEAEKVVDKQKLRKQEISRNIRTCIYGLVIFAFGILQIVIGMDILKFLAIIFILLGLVVMIHGIMEITKLNREK